MTGAVGRECGPARRCRGRHPREGVSRPRRCGLPAGRGGGSAPPWSARSLRALAPHVDVGPRGGSRLLRLAAEPQIRHWHPGRLLRARPLLVVGVGRSWSTTWPSMSPTTSERRWPSGDGSSPTAGTLTRRPGRHAWSLRPVRTRWRPSWRRRVGMPERRPRGRARAGPERRGDRGRRAPLPHHGGCRRRVVERPRHPHGRHPGQSRRPPRTGRDGGGVGANIHAGDGRATDMAAAGMVNVGQLVRERDGEHGAFCLGSAGQAGMVIAAPAWRAPLQVVEVPPARWARTRTARPMLPLALPCS